MFDRKLLEKLLEKEISLLENKDIYDNGYPESRLIPSNFFENCEDTFIEETKEEICELIEEILREYI